MSDSSISLSCEGRDRWGPFASCQILREARRIQGVSASELTLGLSVRGRLSLSNLVATSFASLDPEYLR